ncbi:MAG TPA: hypothetical protein IAC95_04330 [Candidatus Fimimonas gallinarum]|uniref:Uncharacterized protein n=1 Tax=Candidatus Fimimonas gallinarum TaxID=2840821 RepID=A0A9D1E454_9BACT|nr:hypothetical protein [Candidatus Fimimonas gallinarum]
MKKLLKIFAVMFIVSVALLAVAAYVPNGDVADAVTADCTHEYSEVVLAQQPSCTQKGWLEHYTCTLCGKYFVKVGEDMVEVDWEDISSPVLVHKWSDWFVKPATCTEEGGEMRYCALCGATEHRGDTIDATGHTYNAVTTGNNVCTVCHQHEITQAEIVEKLYALERGEALDGTYLLTGIVTNVDGTNATIIVEEKYIYLYSFQSTDAFLVGDSVSVVGTLKHFGNYYEFDAGTVREVTHPEYALTFGANVEGYTVTLADGSSVPTSATNGTTYEVKITVPSGYKVANVTVNGAVVDMSESGTYSVTVCGETTVHVEIVSKMFSGMVLEATVDSLGLQKTNYTASDGDHEISGYVVNTKDICADSTEKLIQWRKSTGTLTVTGQFSKIVIANTNNYSADSFLITFNNETLTAVVDENGISVDFGGTKEGTVVIKNNTTSVKYISSIQFFATICEHEWGKWTSNDNGTHRRTCSVCEVTETADCTFENGVCSVCNAQEVITHSVTVGYTVNGNAATTLPEGVTVEILGEDGQSVTDLANVVEGTTLKVKITAEGFDIAVTCNSESLTLQDGEGAFVVDADVTLSVTLTTHTQHKGTAEDPYSVADALAIAGAIGQGNYTEKVYIKGLIVDVGSDRGDFRSNIYIADTADGTKMLVFSANFSEEVPSIYEGDTVVFHGYITNYEGILEIAWKEIAGKGKDYPEMTAVTRGSRTITVTMENATTTLPDSAPIESTVTFTVTPDEGYEVVSVKVNGNFITPVDGTYSFVVGETNAVEVTIQKITPKHQVSVNGDVEGYTVTTDNDITLPGEVYEGTLKFTVTAPEGYQVATVSVGETVLTLGDDGYYTTEVSAPIAINVTFKMITKVSLELTSANLGLGSYNTSIKTVAVDGVDFEYLQLMKSTQYPNSIQMKSRDGYVSNVTPFSLSISQVTLKAAKDLASAKVQVEMKKAEGDWVTIGTYVASNFTNNQLTISVDLSENYLYVKVSSASKALYFTSITIECEKLCEHVVETWTPNNNGTHTGTCSLCGQEITEDCTYNEEHKCSVCGYAEPTRTVTVNFDETNESSTFGNYQWVNENEDVVEAPGDVYAGTVLYLKVSVNDYTTHTISEVKATDTTLEVVAEDDGSKTYKFVVGTGDITITITFGEAGATKTWKLVTDVTTLKAGDQIVLANVANNAIAGDISKSVMQKLACTFNADNSEIPELPNNAVVLTLGGNEGSWTFANSNGQLLGTTDAKKVEWSSGTTTWTISISNGDATIDSTESSCGYLQYNKNSPRFTTYTSKQTLPQIFKLS